MRHLLLVTLLIAATGCGRVETEVPAEQKILGAWRLMGMTREPVPLDKITESQLIGGSMTFNEDKTFEGEVQFPEMPEKNMKVSGTYSVEGEKLTIVNRTNNSTTRSTLRFERDFMIATPETQGALIAYYKRSR